MGIAIDDRVYATEEINYSWAECGAPVLRQGAEGTVINVTDDDGWPLIIEWDAGVIGAAASESVALVPPLAR